jgi:type II secretory ATPase GspE/PulE/Tfp pilus assembly ATPase PilB-like protein
VSEQPDRDPSPQTSEGETRPAADEAIDFREMDTIDFASQDAGGAATRLVEYAVDLPASDLFINTNEQETQIEIRYLGLLRPLARLNREDGRRLVNHFKAIAGMDLGQRMRPEDGRWVFTRADGHKVDLRINTIPTLHGEDMAIRLLGRDVRLLELENLGLPHRDLSNLRSMLASPGGLILVTGPTGAGKTTTLYACIHRLNDGLRRICTIEDPVEYAIPGVRQSQVNMRIGLDFPELLRSVLRQSADVILVGEIRDPITAETAVRAAKSGQLVLATLHASIAAAAIDSMLALGVHPHFLASGLLGIITQRLARTLCPKCKVAVDLSESPHSFDEVRKWLEPGQGETIYAASGCEECRMEGHVGRTGVFEVLRVTRDLRQLIANRATTRQIRDQAVKEGMLDVRRAALLKVAEGVVSTEELMRVIPTEYLLPDAD